MHEPSIFYNNQATVLFLSIFSIHLIIVFFILPGGDLVHPFLVLEVPADRLFDPLFELQAGLPAQLA